MKDVILTLILIGILSGMVWAEPERIDLSPYMHEVRLDLAERYPRGEMRNTGSVDTVQVGDWRSFWCLSIDGKQGRPDSQHMISARCYGVGEYCYIFIEENNPHIPSFEYERAAQQAIELFEGSSPADPERGVYQLDQEVFGDPPDAIDNDPRIYILLMDIQDHMRPEDGESYVAGYFWPPNQYQNFEHNGALLTSLGWFYSNEVEMITIDTITYAYNGHFNALGDVLAHELQHLIHSGVDQDESVWLDECFSMYAMYHSGYDPGIEYLEGKEGVSGFFDDSNLSLIDWDMNIAHYGKAMSWILYLEDRYGGSDFVGACFKSPLNGLESINAALDQFGYNEQAKDIFQDWVITNYVDFADTTRYGGKYSFDVLDFYAIDTNDIRNGVDPIPVESLTDEALTINSWAAKYIRFTPNPAKEELHLPIAANPDRFKAWILEEDGHGEVVEILTEIPPGDLSRGTYILQTSPDAAWYTAALVNTSGNPESIQANPFYAGTHAEEKIIAAPNPFTPDQQSVSFRYQLPQEERVSIAIYDLSGDKICNVVDGFYSQEGEVAWDGKNDAGNLVASGVYVYVFQAESTTETGKIAVFH